MTTNHPPHDVRRRLAHQLHHAANDLVRGEDHEQVLDKILQAIHQYITDWINDEE